MVKAQKSQQPTISSFFSSPAKQRKRPASPIDLTLDSDSDTPPKKKSKVNNGVSESQVDADDRGTLSGKKHVSAGHAKQWRFEPSSPDKPVPEKRIRTAAEEATRKKNHEAFKKRLLGENSTFVRPQETSQSAVDAETDQPESAGSGEDSDAAFTLFKKVLLKSKGKGKAASAAVKKKVEDLGPSGQTWTPLEKQVLKLKEDNPGVLLMVEVGYKLKFFEDDARIASEELGIACFPHRNFTEAMIPVHRRDIHLKKLLSKGHKVGIVQQTETAALKAVSENRNTPFERKLTHLYTAATYVDELDSVDDIGPYDAPPLMCIIEELKGMGIDERVSIAMITICPSTGDVVYDEFEDTHMRIELETRIVHTKPAELLLPAKGLSKSSEKMLAHFVENILGGSKIRTERFKGPMSYTDAFAFVSSFYTDKTKAVVASESFNSGKLMAAVTDFPQRVVVALAHAIKYLSAFSIADAFLETKFFSKFTTRAHMLLNGNTLTNLEIYRNDTDYTTHGSLIWILDRTKTKFGARLLKSWVGRPLVDKSVLQARVDAVEEIISSTSDQLFTLRALLVKLPDLAKGLSRIQYGKCTPQELAVLLPAFNKIATAFEVFESPSDVGCKSMVLNEVFFSLPKLKEPMKRLLDDIVLKKAKEGRKDAMWQDPEKYPAIADIDLAIQTVEAELIDELKLIRKKLRKPSLQYSSVAGEEYIVELKKSDNCQVPDSWHIVSRTKSTTRYHTPDIKRKLQERERCKETLEVEAQKAFLAFLTQIAQSCYGVMRSAVNNLAIVDCLFSLAQVALQQGYVRPEFTDESVLEIVEGRHPMVEALRSDPFVPNTIIMGGRETRSKVITGPNMGGKSSCVRMISLIAIMAQIGSYVPAQSVRLGMLDGILTRMGASDELARGRSTFMVEMSETSEILQTATENTLVILDELGRGTSTVDGIAVASAVLEHLLEETKCKTLFITHYPLVATDLEKKYPRALQNLHMGYTEDIRIDGTRDITFLYRLTRGMAKESFGVECARLAGVPEEILSVATERSRSMRTIVEQRSKQNIARKCTRLINKCLVASEEADAERKLDELRIMIGSMSVSSMIQATQET